MVILDFLKNVFISYLILTFILTVFSIIKMYVVRYRVGAKKYGLMRLEVLKKSHRYKCVQLYSDDEIEKSKKKKVVKLHFFPADNRTDDTPIIICPGGGYDHLVTNVEGYPIAAKFNELGRDAFILEYRTGRFCGPYAPMEDLAEGIRYIEKNQNMYHINFQSYLLCGFSAGGNLCGVMATKKYGYEKYKIKKPSGLILGYPWTNINHWIEHPYWNIWVGLLAIYLSERGNINLFGFFNHFKKEYRDSVCLQQWIDSDYPDTYMFACSKDMLVPCGAHTDVLEEALIEKNVCSKYEKFLSLPHGIGLGVGSKAQVWPENSLKFFEEKSYDS